MKSAMLKCEKCGVDTMELIPVDENDFAVFLDIQLTQLKVEGAAREVCPQCCRGARIEGEEEEDNEAL